jgi:SAM-dependent methyltransferase
MKVLHLGSGRVGKTVQLTDHPEAEIISLDMDGDLNPDIICRLGVDPIPLPDDSVDMAIAVHVLEHIGRTLEEWLFFWEELYRVLVPDGRLQFESPLWNSVWAWGDPGHLRALSPQSFIYLCQENYRVGGSITPYRIRCDFLPTGFSQGVDSNPEIAKVEPFSHFRGELRAIKPLHPWWEE